MNKSYANIPVPTPTQNPVPSADLKDHVFGGAKIDEFVTSQGWTYTDRLGVTHYTIEGLRWIAQQAIAAYGYVTMDSFEDGNTLTLPNQVLRFEATGEYYRWDGAFPKVVPADSTPELTGGVGTGAWISVGDAALRKQISDPDGVLKYPEFQVARWRDVGDIRGWGAIPGQDATDAINAAISDRSAKDWGTSSDVIINGNYKIEGKVLLTTDVRLKGNWATITSSSDDWIFESAYKNANGDVVTNHGLPDDVAIGTARLRGTVVSGITFVGVSKVFNLSCFTERCELQDLAFEGCGIAWDARLSFFPQYRNIVIRGVKPGYENSYAYQIRHQCNDIKISSVSVAGRKFGRLIDDDITPSNPNAVKNCQNIIISGCSYEQMENGSRVNISTYGYEEENIYAEEVSGNLFIFDNGEHYDTLIRNLFWCYDVEAMGTFNNLKGRSAVWQSSQQNYSPPKRSAVQFVNSVVVLHASVSMGDYKTIGLSDYGVAFDSSSKVTFDSVLFSNDGAPVNLNQTNLVKIPVNISGLIPFIDGKVIGSTGVNYTISSDSINLSTDIYWSNNNLILVSVTIYQTSNPENTHSATAILMNGFKMQLAGQPVSYERDGDLTMVRVTNPAEGGDKSWLTNGDFSIEGCVRVL